MKLVVVYWMDATGEEETWLGKDVALARARAMTLCVSIGFLLDSNESHVVIAQSYWEDQVGGVFAIPAGAVKKIKELAP